MPSSLLLALPILLHASTVSSSASHNDSVIVEEGPSTTRGRETIPPSLHFTHSLVNSTRPPRIDPFPMYNYFGNANNPLDDVCIGSYNADVKRILADDLDLRKMMGRWFVGLDSSWYHKYMKQGHRCIIYEFERLIIAQHTNYFDVTLTYRTAANVMRKDFGFMRSSEPRNAMLKYTSSWYQKGDKFWIYKIGPEGKDSFGRLQYEYAIVRGCYGPVAILVRNTETFNENFKKEILTWLENNDYSLGGFTQRSYYDCYFDSIAQSVGASDEISGGITKEASLTITRSSESKTERNCSDPNLVNATLAGVFDTRKMMGRWFEALSSLPSDNRTCIVHEYCRLELIQAINFKVDGHYRIEFGMEKSYREAGHPLRKDHIIWGNAFAKSTDQEIPKFDKFWIYKIGPEVKDSFGRVQYEYAILSNCDKSWVLVLTRNPYMFKDNHQKSVLTWLEENDFHVGEEHPMIQNDYTSCHYADSITEISGQS